MKYFLLSLSLFVTIITSAQKPAGLTANTKAPDFTATDQNSKKVSLKELTQKGPVVLIFYRGYWCPYCNKQLKGLEDSLSQISSKGATLVAITPEKPEYIQKTVTNTKASYPVLYDEGLKIMKLYDVSFTMDSATQVKYKGYGLDLNKINGANGFNLPVPAVYIINKEGVITWRYFDTNYAKRASVKEILEKL
jgi:peroxiredoxin